MKTYRKPYRVKRKKSIIRNRFFRPGVLFFILFVVIFYFLFFSEVFRVKMVIVTGENKVSKQEIGALVEKKNIFLIDLNKIETNILDNFPQISAVEAGRGFPDALNILVVERLALANWCQQEQCFLLDAEGVIFEEVRSETNLIKIMDDRQNVDSLFPGKTVIEKELLKKILEIKSGLENIKIEAKESIILNDRLSVKTSEDWRVYFSSEENINWQLTKLSLVLEKEIPLEKQGNLEYVELRFGNKAYYKYRD